MGRRRRETDWEGIIQAGAALIVLFGITGFLNGGSSFVTSTVAFIIPLAKVLVPFAVLIGIVVLITLRMKSLSASQAAGFSTLPALTESEIPDPRPNVEDALDALDWFQLEKLVVRLFELKGNVVLPRGGAKADGGIDLVVQTESTKAAVQCKHWCKGKCGPAVVRELIGSMVHENLPQGFLICRTATEEAKSLAASHRIRIIERAGLIERIEDAVAQPDGAVIHALFHPPKLCPKCGAEMVRRIATKGRNPGAEFWGCSAYPDCRQILKI